MNFSRAAIITFLFFAAGAVVNSTADAASVIPQSKVVPQNTGRPANGTTLQPTATITFTTGMTPQQLLAMPDATIVKSADGKQSTSVGALRANIQARKQQLETFVKSKIFGGIKVSTLVPRGAKAVADLRTKLNQENSTALSLHQSTVNQVSRINQALNPTPGIFSVNGKRTGFLFTPGNKITIIGHGFGTAISQVNIIGAGLPGGIMQFVVEDWRDNQILALLPAVPLYTSGVPDTDVDIQVITSNGQTFHLSGGTFYATRNDIVVTTHLDQMLRISWSNLWTPERYDPNWAFDGVGLSMAFRARDYPGQDAVYCLGPGVDQITTVDPGHGFVVTSLNAVWGPSDSGSSFDIVVGMTWSFIPGYGFGNWNGDTIPISWGVQHYRADGFLWTPSMDICSSDYSISVTLTGPAGVAPF